MISTLERDALERVKEEMAMPARQEVMDELTANAANLSSGTSESIKYLLSVMQRFGHIKPSEFAPVVWANIGENGQPPEECAGLPFESYDEDTKTIIRRVLFNYLSDEENRGAAARAGLDSYEYALGALCDILLNI